METMIDDATSGKLNKLLQDLAHFIALYEESEDRLAASKEATEQQLDAFRKEINNQIEKVNAAVAEISEVMTAAGAARWRVSAEKALKEGDEHKKALEEIIKQFKHKSEQTLSRLDHVSIEAEKNITKAIAAISLEQEEVVDKFKQRAEASYQGIERVSNTAMQTIQKFSKWVRLERIVIAVLAAFIASFLTGLYINAEWPWEAYQTAAQERNIGKAVLTAWPNLTVSQQEEIKNSIGIEKS